MLTYILYILRCNTSKCRQVPVEIIISKINYNNHNDLDFKVKNWKIQAQNCWNADAGERGGMTNSYDEYLLLQRIFLPSLSHTTVMTHT